MICVCDEKIVADVSVDSPERSDGTSLSWIFFICPFARSFALLTYDIGVSASGTRISNSNKRGRSKQRKRSAKKTVRGRSTVTVDGILDEDDVRVGRLSG